MISRCQVYILGWVAWLNSLSTDYRTSENGVKMKLILRLVGLGWNGTFAVKGDN